MLKISLIFISLLVAAIPAQAGDNGLMGALLGAGAGAAIGHSVDRTGGAGKGAAIGAIGGYLIGSQIEGGEQKPVPKQSQAWTPPEGRQGNHQQGTSLTHQSCANGQADADKAYQARNPEDKVFHLENAVQRCPGDARIHNDLGTAYYNRGYRYDRDRAREQFSEALRLRPDYTIARKNLSSL